MTGTVAVRQQTIERLKTVFPSEVVEEALQNGTLVLKDEQKVSNNVNINRKN